MKKEIWSELLLLHNDRYSSWQVQDALKLLFQGVLGGGHLIQDVEANRRYFFREYDAQWSDSSRLLIEDLGHRYCRIYLPSFKGRRLDPEKLQEVFVKSANQPAGTKEDLISVLAVLAEMIENKELNFQEDALANVEEYIEADCPMISHSPLYRELYRPSYRVIDKKYIKLLFEI